MILDFWIVVLNVLAHRIAEHVVCLEWYLANSIVHLWLGIRSQLSFVFILFSDCLQILLLKFIYCFLLPFHSLVIRKSNKSMIVLRLESAVDLLIQLLYVIYQFVPLPKIVVVLNWIIYYIHRRRNPSDVFLLVFIQFLLSFNVLFKDLFFEAWWNI